MKSDQFAFAFFEKGSETFYFEAGDISSIWATFGVCYSNQDNSNMNNVESPDFVFVSAASLTAAASIIGLIILIWKLCLFDLSPKKLPETNSYTFPLLFIYFFCELLFFNSPYYPYLI